MFDDEKEFGDIQIKINPTEDILITDELKKNLIDLAKQKTFVVLITPGMIYIRTVDPAAAIALLNKYASVAVSLVKKDDFTDKLEAGTAIVFFYAEGKLIPVKHIYKYDDIIKLLDSPQDIAKLTEMVSALGAPSSEFSGMSFALGFLLGLLSALLIILKYLIPI